MSPQGRQRPPQADMAPVALETHRGFTMPERLWPKPSFRPVSDQPVAEAKRGLETCAQIFHTENVMWLR